MAAPVVLVNEDDVPQGTAEKLRAHREGWLHRALSVFVFDEVGRLLIQQRAADKYHSGGLWSNTCCSHPRPDEEPLDAAERRLHEEMGFSCSLTPTFHFTYYADVGSDLIEHEYDHVFVGRVDGAVVNPNPSEVNDWAWQAPSSLLSDVSAHPDRYTAWFRRLFPSLVDGKRADGAPAAPNATAS